MEEYRRKIKKTGDRCKEKEKSRVHQKAEGKSEKTGEGKQDII